MNIDNITESVKNNKMALLFLIVLIVIIINLVVTYKKTHQNQVIVIDKPLVNDITKHISYDRLPVSSSNVQCSYSVWIYINDRPGNAKRTYGDNHFYRIFSKDVDDIVNHSGKTKFSCLKKEKVTKKLPIIIKIWDHPAYIIDQVMEKIDDYRYHI